MKWNEELVAFARALGRDVYEHTEGIGVEFADGADAFWLLPGEVTSTIALPREGSPAVDEILAAYHRIDGLRGRALHVIRHHLAAQKIRVDMRRKGEWGLEDRSGCSTSLDVGGHLTLLARDSDDIAQIVRALFEGHWIKGPSPKEVLRYLDLNTVPASEEAAGADAPTPAEKAGGILQVLGWMGICRALESIDERSTAQSIAAAGMKTGRIAQALLRLAERLPAVDASIDLLKRLSVISLAFSDVCGGSFDIDVKSRDLSRRIALDGPLVVGDQLAEEYLRIKARRHAVIGAITRTAAARGWIQEQCGGGLFGGEPIMHLGRTSRDVSFSMSLLDRLAREAEPPVVLAELLSAHPEFADECVRALDNPTSMVNLASGNLRPATAPAAPELHMLTPDLIARTDAIAAEAIRRYLESERTIWEYHNREVFDRAIDTWASMEDWVRVAERHMNDEWVHPCAAVILLDAGDPRGDGLARKYLETTEPHHEVGFAGVALAWRYRHALPDIARKWFAPVQHASVPYLDERIRLGDPVARRVAAHRSSVTNELDLDAMEPARLLKLVPQAQERVHQQLIEWARTDHHWSPPFPDRLRLAEAMGWRDVAQSFEENPFALPGLLTIDRRSDQFDEPGMLLAGEFLLVWSKVAPSKFLARLIATAMATDLLALAREAARRSSVGKPEVAANLDSTFDIYGAWREQLDPVLAIVWSRCRHLVDQE